MLVAAVPALAVPTDVTARVLAWDAKFVGTGMASAGGCACDA